jgi:DNA-binding MarR family transcriptional regulator
MNASQMYEYLERLSNLMRTSVRKAGLTHGLQPIQMEALHYLSRCNHYSNTPVAVAEFLGLTKGTVSQTLGVLEADGLLQKRTDIKDRRVVHLTLTPAGEAVVKDCIPPVELTQALAQLGPKEPPLIGNALETLLQALQQANGLKSFGACRHCRYHELESGGQRTCGLTQEALSDSDADKICREHQAVA